MKVTRGEFVRWAAIGVYLAAFIAAIVWAQWWTIRQPEPFVPLNVEPWLRSNQTDDGPRIDTFPGPPTGAGLHKAVRDQWAIVSTLDYLGRTLWSSYECSLVIFEDGLGRSDLELDGVLIEMVGPTSADVSTRLKPRGGDFEFWKTPSRERWVYRAGAWVNETCSYNDGPSLLEAMSESGMEIRIGSGDVKR